MKKLIVKWLAKVLPDYCVFERLLNVNFCKLNPWYTDIMTEKMRQSGWL